jgi:hypothetical protein
MHENVFSQSNGHTSNDQIVDQTMKFAAGTKITVYNDGSTLNVFAVGTDGHIKWAQQSNGVWSAFSTIDTTYTLAAGAPLVGYAIPGVFSLFAVATDGYVKQYQYLTSLDKWVVNNFSNMLQFASGAPLVAYSAGSFLNLFGVLPNGNVGQEQYSSSGWAWGSIAAGNAHFASATPLSIYEAGSVIDLFGVATDGQVGQVQFLSSGWQGSGWEIAVDSRWRLAQGQTLSIYGTSTVTDLFGVDVNGNMAQVQWAGSWGNGEIVEPTKFASGSSTSVYTDSSGVQEVFGVAANGDFLDDEFYTSWNLH